MERLALRNNVKEDEQLRDIQALSEDIGMKPNLHGPMDYPSTMKLRFCLGDLDLPEKSKLPRSL